MRFHAQNLNERRDGTEGSMLKQGRVFLWFTDNCTFRVEWLFSSGRCLGFGFATGGPEDDLQLSLHFWFLSLWFTVSGLFGYDKLNRRSATNTGIMLNRESWFLMFDLFAQTDSFPVRKGWSKNWFLVDAILGRAKYTEESLKKVETVIPMPEKQYPCTIKLKRSSWKRSRWPFTHRVLMAEVDIPDGIPFPGKGTCDYNCGDDALFGLSRPARTVPEAIGATVECVLDYRERYPL